MNQKFNLPWMNYCGYCGSKFENQGFEKTCKNCNKTTWAQNKTAVCVSVPVWNKNSLEGFLYTERSIHPVGAMCLVSGFQDFGEDLFKTAAREFQEEVFNEYNAKEFSLDMNEMKISDIKYAKNDNINIICISSSGINLSDIEILIKNFKPNNEVSAIFIAKKPVVLEWEIHTEFLKNEFHRVLNLNNKNKE